MLHIKRGELTTLIESARDRLPNDQYLYLMRVAEKKREGDLTAMELSEICRCLKCLPTDIVQWK